MKLWKHQQGAVDWMEAQPNVLLAMDMGTGKTACIVTAVAALPEESTVLIICPKTVLNVWLAEFRKFYPGQVGEIGLPGDQVVVTTLGGSSPSNPVRKSWATKKKVAYLGDLGSRCRRLGIKAQKVVVINYEAAARPEFLKFACSFRWDLAVLDESHRIKSAAGKHSKALAKIRSDRRVCLTGTPLPHSPLDAFGQFRFLDVNLFGWSFTKFRARYARMGGYCVHGRPVQVLGFQNLDELEAKMATRTYTVRAEDVLDLPEAHHVVRECPLPDKVRRQYVSMEKEFVAWLESGEVIAATNVLDRLGKLCQLTSGHARYEDKEGDIQIETVHLSKHDALQEILEDLPPGEPMVVFCRFTPDLDAVHSAASLAGRECWELSGRCNELEPWQQARDGSVLAVQIQAGGVGISLVRARYCCYYSQTFSLGDYEQSLARCKRPGQTRTVTYFHLVVPSSVDGKIYKALRARKSVVDEVMTNVANVES